MILVTGGTGMTGAHLLFHLIQKGEQVRATYRSGSFTSSSIWLKNIFHWMNETEAEEMWQKIEWFEADILNYVEMLDACEGITSVYHCAAIVSFDPHDKFAMLTNNVRGTANIVNICVEKMIPLCHVSSIAALGEAGEDGWVKEDCMLNSTESISDYSKSKFLSELEVWRGIEEGLQAIIVNPSVILGSGNWKKGSPQLISAVAKGMKFYTEGITGFVDVIDVVKCMILLMENKKYGERYILSAENISYRELFGKIANLLGKKPPVWKATTWLLEVAWRMESLKYLIGKKPLITKNTARSANHKEKYSNQKFSESLSFEFSTIERALERICRNYLRNEK